MTNRKLSVSIGIPAYNEQAKIGNLIRSLLASNNTKYVLDQIVVLSDGSTDGTVDVVRRIRNSRVKVIEQSTRKGKPAAVNKIFAYCMSDIVVVIDADLHLKGHQVIDQLVEPFYQNNKVQLTSPLTLHEKPDTFAGRIAQASNMIWEKAITYPTQNELYFCSGSVRAFGKKLYKSIIFPDYSADDAFAYLACRSLNYEFAYVPNVMVFQKLPTSLYDVYLQQSRFVMSEEIQAHIFPQEIVNKYYVVTLTDKIRAFLWYVLRDPAASFAYIALRVWITVRNIFGSENNSALWTIASSTKK